MRPGRKVQNGHGDLWEAALCDCGGRSHMMLAVIVLLAMLMTLPACTASDPCNNIGEMKDEWRDLSVAAGGPATHCDQGLFAPDKWYSFHLRGRPAWIPTECVKPNRCGANVGMRVDLLGQKLPAPGENITAALCGAWDVLGKYDCCVLRTLVNIARCPDDRLVYNFPTPFDRCNVAVCSQGEPNVPPGAFAKMGGVVGANDTTDIPETTEGVTEPTATPEMSSTSESISDTTSDLQDTTQSPASPQQQSTDSNTSTLEVETTNQETASTDENVVDTTSATPDTTEAPHLPPQPLIQQTTVTGTSTPEEETSTTDVKTEPALSPLSNDTTSQDGAQIGDHDTTSAAEPQASSSVTPVQQDTETPIPVANDTTALTNLPSDLVHDATESTTTASPPPQTPELETDGGATETPVAADPETTSSADMQNKSSEAISFISSDTTSEGAPTSPTEIHSSATNVVEDLSSTSMPLHVADGGSSPDLVEETTTAAIIDTTSTLSTSTETSESPLTTADDKEASETSTETKTESKITEQTAVTTTTTDSLLDAASTRQSTKGTQSMSPTLITTEKSERTITADGDVIVDENLRFVFKGEPKNVASVSKVYNLLEHFLKRAKGESDWLYELYSVSDATNFENRSTYMDFRIVRKGNDLKDGTIFFKEERLREYIRQNNMTLITYCRVSKNCQTEPYFSFGTPLASVFEENAPAFTTVIVLCSICLLVLVVVLLYYRYSKRGSWKAPEPEPDVSADNRRHINGTQSPFTDDQIMKDEMVDNAPVSYDTAKPSDPDLSGTWVIPLEQDHSAQVAVAITTEDTQL